MMRTTRRRRRRRRKLQKNRKNAIAARLNRQRKKRYVEGLEVQVGDLEHEKQQLQNECEHLEGRVKQLEGEVVYLRSVLSNDSALAGLLNLVTCAGRTGLLKTHTSPRTNSLAAEHDYAGCGENKMSFRAECVDTVLERAERNGSRYPLTESETPKNGVSVGGLCLHVDRGLVSVELCAVCAQQAADLRKAKNIQE
uniref:X-box-binding protein 1 n=1 Tax=Eptatretus burgeri TaxID=7764 RepID=A0A8C4Q3G9_EPTBU